MTALSGRVWIRRAITLLVIACVTCISMLWWLSETPRAERVSVEATP